MKLIVVLLAALIVVGCKKKGAPEGAAQAPAAAVSAPQAVPVTAPEATPAKPLNPDDVLVEVAGVKLTVGEAQKQMEMRFPALDQEASPEQRQLMERQMLGSLADQFVVRTLLVEEADRQKIGISGEEEAAAYDKIRASLPKETTLEEIMQKSPLGEEGMKAEVLVGLRINKLLAEYLTNRVAVSDEDITKFMDENQEKLKMPERVHARHILITSDAEDSDEVKAEKKAKAEKIRAEVAGGADFAKMAEENSDCPSREKGGDLGTFPRGQMVPAFEDVAFSMPTGTVSDVVETQFGYHIIEVTDHQQAGSMGREEVAEALKNQKRQQAMRSFIDELRNNAKIEYGEMLKPSMP